MILVLHLCTRMVGGKQPKIGSKRRIFEFGLAEQGASATTAVYSMRPGRTSAYDAPISVPHLSRFVFDEGQPAFVFSGWAGLRRTLQIGLVAACFKAHGPKLNHTKKGKKKCLRKPGLSRQWRLSPWRAASSLILNVQLLVQPLAQLPPTRLAPIAPQQPWLVPLPVCCATTLASAARPTKFSAAQPGGHE